MDIPGDLAIRKKIYPISGRPTARKRGCRFITAKHPAPAQGMLKKILIGGPMHYRAAAARENKRRGDGMGHRDTKKVNVLIKTHSAAPGIFGTFCPLKKYIVFPREIVDTLPIGTRFVVEEQRLSRFIHVLFWDEYPIHLAPRMDILGDRGPGAWDGTARHEERERSNTTPFSRAGDLGSFLPRQKGQPLLYRDF